jgi:hypothetical protein
MAKELKFNLTIDTDKAEDNLDDLSNSLDDIKEQSKIDLLIDNAESVKSIKDLRKAYKDLQNAQLEFGEGTEEFKKAAIAAGSLRDRLDDVNDSIGSYNASPIENINNSFDDMKNKIFALDIDGAKTAFGNFGTNIINAGKSILGLGKGLNIATIAARGFAVALAATGLTLVIAAVAVLVNSFDDLSKAGGIVGKIFTDMNRDISNLKQVFLELSDFFGLIDKAALDSAEAQKNALRDLEDDYAINADKYDELTRLKKKADIDYLKSVDEVNKRTDIDEKRKNELIVGYNQKKIRDIQKGESDAKKKKDDEDKKLVEEEKKKNEDAVKRSEEKQTKIREAREKAEALELENVKKFRLEEETKELERFAREGGSLEQHLMNLENIRIESLQLEKSTLLSQGKDITEIERQLASDRADIRKKNMDDDKIMAEEQFNKRYGTERLNLIKQFQNGEIKSKEELDIKLKQIEINRLREESAMLKVGSSERINIETQIVQAEIDLIKMKKDAAISAEDEIKAKRQEALDMAQTGLQAASDVVGTIGQVLAASSENRINDIKQEESDRIASLERQFKAGLINEEQLASGTAKIQEKARRKELAEKKKAFEQEKAIKITMAVIGTAQAVIAASANAFPLNIVMMALAAAIGAAQIGIIASQKFPSGGGGGGASSVPSIPTPPSISSASAGSPAGPSINFTGAAPGANMVQGGMSQQVIVVNSNVSISESEITGTQQQVSMYENSSSLGGG